ncbi:MAG: hypothetical protein ABIN91_20210, partial [Mucilaginibacter sp.]|uniref:hypothetical protein n=1 Tax=Mucilaginibacter sp. TaxID=1882438 RepID=UPI003263FECA
LGFFETQESRAKNQDKKEQEAGSLKPEALVVDADGDLGFVAGNGTKKDENILTLSPLVDAMNEGCSNLVINGCTARESLAGAMEVSART